MKRIFAPLFGLILLFVIFSMTACIHSTEPPTPTPNPLKTEWTVDTQSFYTYNTFSSGAGNGTILSGTAQNGNSSPSNNGSFTMTFHLPYIPAHGEYLLNCSGTSTSDACLDIKYHGIDYRPDQGHVIYLKADSANQRAKITLPPTLLRSTLMQNDSIIVSGIFYQS